MFKFKQTEKFNDRKICKPKKNVNKLHKVYMEKFMNV